MTDIVIALFGLLAAVLTAAVPVIVGLLAPYIKSKNSLQMTEEIEKLVQTAVTAAEQMYVGAKQGKKKKDYVIEFLSANGISLDEENITALIEAAVYTLKN